MNEKIDAAYKEALDEACAALQSENIDDAIVQCDNARNLKSDAFEALFFLGLISLKLRDFGSAIKFMEEGHNIAPQWCEFADALSALYSRVGQLSQSLYYAKAATTMDSHPLLSAYLPSNFDSFEINMKNVGLSTSILDAKISYFVRDYAKAIEYCERELSINPNHYEAIELLGKSLVATNEYDRAIEILINGAKIEPQNKDSWNNLGDALLASGRPENALEIFEDSVDVDPDAIETRRRIALTLAYLDDDLWANYPNVVETMGEMLKLAVHEPSSQESAPNFAPDDGFINVAFIVNDDAIVDKHEILIGMFQRFDPERFRVFVYQQYIQPHPATLRMKGIVHNWRATYDIDDITMSKIIHNDCIHHIVDMCGMVSGERQALLAANTKPNRIGWLGFPLAAPPLINDMILSCDLTMEADLRDSAGGECISLGPALFAYPGGSVMLGEGAHIGPVKKNGYVTFGAFLDMPRIAQSMELWLDVLRRKEDSRLLLGGGKDQQKLWPLVASLLEGSGVEHRVSIQGDSEGLSERTHLFLEADIILDSQRINGMGEICDALWMGLPVVTLIGSRRSSRIGASILEAAGLSEWIAHTPEEYIETALNLAACEKTLGRLRKSLRKKLEQSQLVNTADFVKRFEEILEEHAS